MGVSSCFRYTARWCSSAGAGEGNRTLVFSLEGCCSTIELHPRRTCCNERIAIRQAEKRWWGKQDSNLRRHSQRIYSPPPLPLGTFPRALAGLFDDDRPLRRFSGRQRPPEQ